MSKQFEKDNKTPSSDSFYPLYSKERKFEGIREVRKNARYELQQKNDAIYYNRLLRNYIYFVVIIICFGILVIIVRTIFLHKLF